MGSWLSVDATDINSQDGCWKIYGVHNSLSKQMIIQPKMLTVSLWVIFEFYVLKTLGEAGSKLDTLVYMGAALMELRI